MYVEGSFFLAWDLSEVFWSTSKIRVNNNYHLPNTLVNWLLLLGQQIPIINFKW